MAGNSPHSCIWDSAQIFHSNDSFKGKGKGTFPFWPMSPEPYQCCNDSGKGKGGKDPYPYSWDAMANMNIRYHHMSMEKELKLNLRKN